MNSNNRKFEGYVRMNNIPKNRLKQFGLSIKCNRKRNLHRTNAAKWTQSNFCKDICSQNLLIGVEKGNISRFLENYSLFAERLGLKITYSPDIDKRLEVYTKEIYHAIEYYDFAVMVKYFEKLYELLDPVKDYLWYCDLYYAASVIEGYYMERKFINSDDRLYYADMIGEFSDEWDEMLKAIIFISEYHDLDSIEYLNYFKSFGIDKCKSSFNKVNTMLFLYDQDRTRKLLDLARQYEQEWIEQKNDLRLLDLYSIILPCFSFHDVYEVEDVYNTIMDILETHDVPKYKKAECYYGIGFAYYNLEMYDETIENLMQAYKYDEANVIPIYVYIAHAQRMLGRKIELPNYSKKDISKHAIIYQKFYKYYEIIENTPELAEKYIMTHIVPVLSTCTDRCIFEIMQKEVELLANQTNRYKLVVRYRDKVKIPEELNKKKLYFRRTAKR